MDYRERYEAWLNEGYFDSEFREELKNMPEAEVEEAFYKELEFGTAGLRGINGPGSNRMNKYIIRRATQGYARYLKARAKNKPSCAIAYDNRLFSKAFAVESASVLCANGIKTYVFKNLRPTPELSFAVRELKTTGGIVLTASHNPPEYSGYKVYGDDGCQLDTESALELAKLIFDQDGFSEIKTMDLAEAEKEGLLEWLDESFDDKFINAITKQILHPESYAHPYKVVYTPLHGTGGELIKKLAAKVGIEDMAYLEEQMKPDPYFTTTKSANPEDEIAFEKSIELAEKVGAELIVASDPDADRLGIMVKNEDGIFEKINGNSIGALLAYYVFQFKKDMPEKPCIVKSIVTSDLTDYIAEDFGLQHFDTLTGFKNICGIIREFEANNGPNFVMGFEESYGYLVGTHARDKDSFVSAMLIIEMAKYYAKKGMSLFDVLEEIYKKYGYFSEHLVSIVRKGRSGLEEIKAAMDKFRASYSEELKSFGLAKIYDYKIGKIIDLETGEQTDIDEERQDCLKYRFKSGGWLALRPSGTEPKIKFYYSMRAESKAEAEDALKRLKESVTKFAGF